MDDLLQMLGNMSQQLGPLWNLMLLAAYLAGLLFVGGSLLHIKRAASHHGGMGQHHTGAGIAGIVCGVFLLSLPTFLDVASMSLFQQSAPDGLTRVSGGSGPDQAFIKFSITIVMLVGLYAVIKGISLFKTHAQTHQPGMFWSATVFLVMGIICINCETFMLMLGRSIGGTFQEIVTKLFTG